MRLKRPVFDSLLPSHFDVATYEPRGLGRSERPDGHWTMQDYADDAHALLDALEWTSAYVLGESFGAMTAMELAIRHPERVSKLCLMVGAAGGAGGSSWPIENLQTLEPRTRATTSLRIQDTSFADLELSDPAAAAARISERMSIDAAFFDDPGNASGYPRLLSARAAHNAYDRLPRIAAPTIVMAGTHDGQAPADACRAVAERLSNAEFCAFDGGHNLAFATPEPMAHLLKSWRAD